jgi:hypothetical protein
MRETHGASLLQNSVEFSRGGAAKARRNSAR